MAGEDPDHCTKPLLTPASPLAAVRDRGMMLRLLEASGKLQFLALQMLELLMVALVSRS